MLERRGTDLNQAGPRFPARFFASSGPAIPESQFSGIKKGRTMNTLIQLKTTLGILAALACFGISPAIGAVSPAPDGGYPNQNTAEGDNALLNLVGGTNNVAVGFDALYSNTMGNVNTANGAFALTDNTTGNGNTAVGYQALESNTMGSRNTATGIDALEENTTGSRNTANGYNALYYSSGSDNIGLGANAGVYLATGSNNIDIGNAGIPSDTGKIRIGTQGMHAGAFIAGIYNVMVTGSPVVVNSSGELGVSTSSVRFKDE